MTTQEFADLRARKLRHFFHVMWKRHWRRILAKRLRQRDAPRWIVCLPGKHPVTLAKLIPVEKVAYAIGFNPDSPFWNGFDKPEPAPPAVSPAGRPSDHNGSF